MALAAQADGWWVRSLIIWAKPNPMPESCTDRPTDAYEHIIMLTKSKRYFWDADAVREPQTGNAHSRGTEASNAAYQEARESYRDFRSPQLEVPGGRNLRNVWTFATQPYKGAHFATFPEEIPRRCILAATSERGCCPACGAPWRRVVKASGGTIGMGSWTNQAVRDEKGKHWSDTEKASAATDGSYKRETIGWEPGCKCSTSGPDGAVRPPRPCLVLDPFAGSGTTGRVAVELNRRAVLLDLAYHDHAEKRTRHVQRKLQ